MFRLSFITLIILCLFICSCSPQINKHSAIESVINELKTPFGSNQIDTIEINFYSYKLNENLLNGYKISKENELVKKLRSSSNTFEWVDNKYAWSINDEEIDFMIKSLKDQKEELWDSKKMNNSRIVVQLVDLPKFDNNLLEDLERQKRFKSDYFIYTFSNPVFNKKKDVFFIQYRLHLILNSTVTLIYKKESGKWIKIGALYPDW